MYYATEEKSLDTMDCSNGYYCNSSSVPRPNDSNMGGLCEVGNFCKNGLTDQCDLGSFMNVMGASECSSTTLGYYQNQPGQSMALDCPEGKFCDQVGLGTTPENCTVGTFYEGTKLIKPESCTPCEPGYVCSETGLTSSTELCNPGTFCPGGSAQQNDNICDQGHYCPEGSLAQRVCHPGTYCAQGAIEMTSCAAGYHCVEKSVTERGATEENPSDNPCQLGHYCPAGSPIQVISVSESSIKT